MDGISSRKLTWGICIVGIAIAIISFFFLPEIIPVHFAGNGVADDFGNKIEIFFNADTPSGCYNLEWYKKYKVCSDAFEDLANSWSI